MWNFRPFYLLLLLYVLLQTARTFAGGLQFIQKTLPNFFLYLICTLFACRTLASHVTEEWLPTVLRGVAPFKPVSRGLQTFLGLFIM